jgi:hypothetical protein
VESSRLIWAFGGFLAGHVLVALVSTWIRAVIEVLRGRELSHSWGIVVASSLFNAGPWALLAAGIFTYYEISEAWAPWFFGSAAAWMLFMGIVAVRIATIQKNRKRGANAA